jgi:Ca2+-binding RTX toxin-like protein
MGNEANIHSIYPSISADGRFVAFFSEADNLVLDDTKERHDDFVHDRQLGQTTRVSVDSMGNEVNSFSRSPSISADGRFVAFDSNASNIVPGDTNGVDDVFVRDLGEPRRDSRMCNCQSPQAILGGPADDVLIGTPDDDIICGFEGDDKLQGLGGNDCLDGGTGNDLLLGGDGNDLLLGGGGDDDLRGGDGDDILSGNAGNDVLRGHAGRDTLFGGAGDDELHGNSDHDVLFGGSGNDDLRGGGGQDTCLGGSGIDSAVACRYIFGIP